MDDLERIEHEAAEVRREKHDMDRERFDEVRLWWEHQPNVLELARWLDGLGYWLGSNEPIDRVIEFFAQPNKWDREWHLYRLYNQLQQQGSAADPYWLVRIAEAIDEQDTTADNILAEMEEHDPAQS